MSQSTAELGKKTRPAVLGRATFGLGSQIRKRCPVPVSYLAKHPCKVCDGKHCTGNCKF
jgi:hypothetical protein